METDEKKCLNPNLLDYAAYSKRIHNMEPFKDIIADDLRFRAISVVSVYLGGYISDLSELINLRAIQAAIADLRKIKIYPRKTEPFISRNEAKKREKAQAIMALENWVSRQENGTRA